MESCLLGQLIPFSMYYGMQGEEEDLRLGLTLGVWSVVLRKWIHNYCRVSCLIYGQCLLYHKWEGFFVFF